jgi:hypothetical protein
MVETPAAALKINNLADIHCVRDAGAAGSTNQLLMRLNLLKGNTDKEWCKTGKTQTVEDRVMSFESGAAVRDE